MQEIICVLDKSGSMQSVADDAVGGFNKFLEDQQAVGDANLTLVWFDDGWEVGHEGSIKNMGKLSGWPSGGMTALRDAIGKTFKHVQERFSREQPEKVIMAILTDGFENASKEFTQETIKFLITDHEKNYGWDVIFLAADQDAWATAQHFGIQKDNAINYASSNTRAGLESYTSAVSKARSS